MLAFVGVLTPDGVLIEASEPAITVAGMARDALIRKPYWDCFWWLNSTPNQQRLRNAVVMAARGEVVRCDVDVQVAGGSTMIIDFRLAPHIDDTGAITYLVASGVDISESVAAVARQRETLRSLELAVDSAQTGIFDWDILTDRVNRSDLHHTICGYGVGAITPPYVHWRDRVHPEAHLRRERRRP